MLLVMYFAILALFTMLFAVLNRVIYGSTGVKPYGYSWRGVLWISLVDTGIAVGIFVLATSVILHILAIMILAHVIVEIIDKRWRDKLLKTE